MTAEEYRAAPGLNWSTLKVILQSPRHYRRALEVQAAGGTSPTPAMIFGTAAHVAVLEPEAFAQRYAAAPDVDRRTKEGRAAWAEFVAANPGREILSADDHARALALAASVREHPEARRLVEGAGRSELSIAWTDARTGIPCKGRLDRVSDAPPCLLDLKTTVDIEAERFGWRAYSDRYLAQLAWYVDGYRAATGVELPAALLAVEAQPPHDVAVYLLDEEALAIGREEWRRALDTLAHCTASGEWPGRYPHAEPIWIPRRARSSDDTWSVTEETIRAAL